MASVRLIIGIVTISTLLICPFHLSFGAKEPTEEPLKEFSVSEIPEEGYFLSPYDEIEIKVAGEDDLSGFYKVNSEGYIIFPILGRIKIDELTIPQVEEKIANLLEKDYFKTKVTIYIQVKKFHKRKVIISGEVRNPGPYEFGEDKDLSLVELITLAGGPTDKAYLNATTVIRQEEKGKSSAFRARAQDMMEAKEEDMILRPGDRVNIPRTNVIVMGEVAKPGKYDFGDTSKMTLLGAISMAGGFTRIAAIDGVTIIRVDDFGNKKNIKVRINNIYKGKEKDIPLEPDDIVVVPESWF